MIYEHKCEQCEEVKEYFRYMADASKDETCETCGTLTKRIFGTYHKDKEFQQYFDEKHEVKITSRRQEERVMKKHGEVYTSDTPCAQNFLHRSKRAKKNPVYFT